MRSFQRARGLRPDGVCGLQTWSALVESGYCLGDRLLYRHGPMMRGDDVAELQRRLNALGFDTGRVDGIFGDSTDSALADFQRNAGLTVDRICGRATVNELLRLQPLVHKEDLVSAVRERERLRRGPRTLGGRRIAVGETGGLNATAATVARALVNSGAQVVLLSHPDGSELAEEANRAEVDVYLGLAADTGAPACASAYYAGYRSESAGGRRLAELVQEAVPRLLGLDDRGSHGMSLPVLRETQMTAVNCEIAPPRVLVEHSADLADLLRDALVTWVSEAWE